MKKISVVFFIIALSFSAKFFAQITHTDSMVKQAKMDARNFRLDKESMQDFRKSGKKYKSKYFEPKVENVTDPKLLKDPDYLQAYRDAVFERTKRRRTAGHYILIGGVVFTVVSAVAGIILIGKGAEALYSTII